MIFWIANLVGLALAYLLGSLPTAYLAGKASKGIDIREHGSRSVGATNALRVLGRWPGLLVFVVDVLKGAAAVVVVRGLLSWLRASSSGAAPLGLDPQAWAPWAVCAAGLLAVFGHSRSIWLRSSVCMDFPPVGPEGRTRPPDPDTRRGPYPAPPPRRGRPWRPAAKPAAP